MKIRWRTLLLFLLLCLIFLTGTYLQGNVRETAAAQTHNDSDGGVLLADELLRLGAAAHAETVRIFTAAFEADLYGSGKPSWQVVRSQLAPYWDADLLDGDLKSFYCEQLSAWGYEMGFVFPLWQPENVKEVRIVSASAGEIVADIKVPTSYTRSEYIRLKMVAQDGNWVIASPLSYAL
ncbi:MAG: hypothetical protein GX167_02920 [Firmicutes bacterium]|jgi:hypothetical protein|nr:hypothetical protein [Bacillota bacterium]